MSKHNQRLAVKISKKSLAFKIKLTFEPNLKTTKKIISFFNLLLFVGTFLFTSVSAFASKQNASPSNFNQKHISAKTDLENSGSHESFFEKNENETESESDAPVPAILLPFLVSFSPLEVLQSTCITVHSAAVKHSAPIYLSVCNFRI
ncbi:hypothetical protein CNR22_23585 [Sphingobacteriaceae bacterium]|nr:hypothetical protein CNR22_23585 [Sphingobacteriaceae bacterium]